MPLISGAADDWLQNRGFAAIMGVAGFTHNARSIAIDPVRFSIHPLQPEVSNPVKSTFGNFGIPRAAVSLITRYALMGRLEEAKSARLVLISAPPGYGKTTAAVQWLGGIDRRVAWISAEESDNDPSHLLDRLITVIDHSRESERSALSYISNQPNPPAAEQIAAQLADELSNLHEPLCLVFDDYHRIESKRSHEIVRLITAASSDLLTTVIITRSDPPFPLSRMRLAGHLVEIRQEDLSFGTEEIIEFFASRSLGDLSSSEIAQITASTQGWPAGLQLTGMVLESGRDRKTVIDGIAAAGTYITDYLVDEVLNALPAELTGFLLESSILETLSPEACMAVTSMPGCAALLETSRKRNLFLSCFDEASLRCKFHPLFRKFLMHQFRHRRPESYTAAHIRASEYYRMSGEYEPAVEHAIEGGDHAAAAAVLETMVSRFHDSTSRYRIDQWIAKIGEETISGLPWLSLYLAGSACLRGNPEKARTHLNRAEELMSKDDTVGAGRCALLRSSIATLEGDVGRIIEESAVAAERFAGSHDDWHAMAKSSQAVAQIWYGEGDLDGAVSSFDDAIRSGDSAGNVYLTASARIQKGIVMKWLGRFDEAEQCQKEVISCLEGRDLRLPAVYGVAESELTDMEHERSLTDCLDRAGAAFERVAGSGDPIASYWTALNFGRIARFEDAGEELGEALGHMARLVESARIPFWFTSMGAALDAHRYIDNGNLIKARSRLSRRGLDTGAEIGHVREAEYIALARLLVEEERWGEAQALIDRLDALAGRTRRTANEIISKSMRARLFLVHNDHVAASTCLERALAVAAEYGLLRTATFETRYLDGLIEPLLIRAGGLGERLRGLLATRTETRGPERTLIEPLSERELEVLRLLPGGLSNIEISEHLYISLNTTKTHLKHINEKLGTNSRLKAVATARRCGIL